MCYTLEKNMTFGLLQKYNKFLGALVMMAVLSVGILSTVHFGMGGMTSDGGKMGDCPFAGVTYSMCDQGTPFHLSAWQGLLAVIPLGASVALVILLASLSFIYLPFLSLWKFQPVPILYVRRTDYGHFLPQSPLKEAFSKGILNPKLF